MLTIKNHRNDNETEVTSKSYLKQSAYRHINIPRKNNGKKWKHHSHTHQHYNRAYSGSAINYVSAKNIEDSEHNQRHLAMQISFSHDRAKVKKINSYLKLFSRKIGINDFVIDTGYEEDARIGFVELVYNLRINENAINILIQKIINNPDLFIPIGEKLIEEYFLDQNDPHNICRSKFKNRSFCIHHTRMNTLEALASIAKKLVKLDKDSVQDSSSRTANYLAKITRKLSTNHFVLHSFLLALPRNDEGYGRLDIIGERFLGRRFNVDPNAARAPGDQNLSAPDAHDYRDDEDEILPFERYRIDMNDENLMW